MFILSTRPRIKQRKTARELEKYQGKALGQIIRATRGYVVPHKSSKELLQQQRARILFAGGKLKSCIDKSTGQSNSKQDFVGKSWDVIFFLFFSQTRRNKSKANARLDHHSIKYPGIMFMAGVYLAKLSSAGAQAF